MIATGMAAGGAVVGSLSASSTTPQSPEGEVDQLVSLYGSTQKSNKDSKGVTHLRVKISDHRKLRDAMSSVDRPVGKVVATNRNTLEFSHQGQKFSVSHYS